MSAEKDPRQPGEVSDSLDKGFSRRAFLTGASALAAGLVVGCGILDKEQRRPPEITSDSTPLDTSQESNENTPSPSPEPSNPGSSRTTEKSTSQTPEKTKSPEAKIERAMPTSIWFKNNELGGVHDFVPVGLSKSGGIGDPDSKDNKDKFGIFVEPKWGPLPGEGRRVITTGHTYQDGSGAYPPDAKDKITMGDRFFVRTDKGQIIEYEVVRKDVVNEENYSSYAEENDLYGYNAKSPQEEMVGITCTNFDSRIRNHTARLIFIARAVGVINP